MVSSLVVIPARLASTRLPGKPLADIAGRPMVLRVWDAAMAANIGPVVVAAADQEIYDAVTAAGGTAILTDPDLPSGSDRVWQATQAFDPDGKYDVLLNLQGDLPTFEPQALHAVMSVMANPMYDVGTLVAPVTSDAEKNAASVVKVACDFSGDAQIAPALYFSANQFHGVMGRYGTILVFMGGAEQLLAQFVALPPSGLEKRESLEQLRALEAGMRIGCTRLASAPFGVDTPEDLERARRAFGA